MEAGKKWNWPTQYGQGVSKGFEKAKEKGVVSNAYEAIKSAMQKSPEPPKK
jgi:hypothetical protein